MLHWGAILIFSVLVPATWCVDLSFPPGFQFGAATAAYQVEGAFNASGKSASIWDTLTHDHPETITDRSSGNVACNSYEMWERDIEIAQELGLQFYRFSISWSRLLPSGFPNQLNEDGVRYYSNLIDGLLKAEIAPVVTLYHWDLPQSLQDLGGWTNPLIADWFADYARVVYSLYGDRVKSWLTINEPLVFCVVGHGGMGHAPGLSYPELADYLCNKHAIIAHAKAYRVYDKEFRAEQNGKVSLANHVCWFEPATPDDVELAEILNQYGVGMYAHPIFSTEGGWPAAVEARIAENSRRQGYTHSRLPAFSQEELEMVRGTYDYFGLNHYTSRLVREARPGEKVGVFPFFGSPEFNVVLEGGADWKQNEASFWFLEYAPGFRKTLKWIKQQYGDIEVLITENGFATPLRGDGDDLNDDTRIKYYRDYLEQLLLAIKEDGVNVSGYTAWTMIDNFEWLDGFTSKFGLYSVDFTSAERTRTARKSARYYASIIRARSLDVPLLREEL